MTTEEFEKRVAALTGRSVQEVCDMLFARSVMRADVYAFCTDIAIDASMFPKLAGIVRALYQDEDVWRRFCSDFVRMYLWRFTQSMCTEQETLKPISDPTLYSPCSSSIIYIEQFFSASPYLDYDVSILDDHKPMRYGEPSDGGK